MSKQWITDGIDENGWTWIAAEKGDTRGVILRAGDAARIVACVNALDGIDDPGAFVAAARQALDTEDNR